MAYRKSTRRRTSRRSYGYTRRPARVSRRRTSGRTRARRSVTRDVRIVIQQPGVLPSSELAFMRPASAPRKRAF